jgi:pantoate--beta-alanine ligase
LKTYEFKSNIHLIESISDLQPGRYQSFVPTMGALHDGHLSLIEVAKKFHPDVLVSIFVNPLQFENQSDLKKYPKQLQSDIEKLNSIGVSAVFAPTANEIYPTKLSLISAGEVGNLYEGKSRTGHFDGVLTVVNRFFELVKPKYAIFGEKDFQQLFLIKNYVRQNNMPVKIIAAPLIRDIDGLALSSRNVRLSNAGRKAALVISKSLITGAVSGDISAMQEILKSEPNFKLDYLIAVDEKTLLPASIDSEKVRILIAGWVEGVRLIDNTLVKNWVGTGK